MASNQVLRKAFTLIELLVVISIIALLVGILLPALSAARAAAQDAQCKSNIRSCGQAMIMYVADDLNGYIPNGMAQPPNADVAWFSQLNRYLNADQKTGFGIDYMRCPSANPDSLGTYGHGYGHTQFWAPVGGQRSMKLDDIDPRTYVYADHEGRSWGAIESNGAGGGTVTFDVSASALRGLYLHMPSGWPLNYDWDGDGVNDSRDVGMTGPYNGFSPLHFGTGNMVFPDGHADGVTVKEWVTNRDGTALWDS